MGMPHAVHYGEVVEFRLACARVDHTSFSCTQYPAEAINFEMKQIPPTAQAPRIVDLGCDTTTGEYVLRWTPRAEGTGVSVWSRGTQMGTDYSISMGRPSCPLLGWRLGICLRVSDILRALCALRVMPRSAYRCEPLLAHVADDDGHHCRRALYSTGALSPGKP